ncbi:MAG TPA: DUF5916 domain-containing protein [Candidatus Eisenbacteria bacterium]|nr:DUF5916 domain-containing protein [Candidatus Eisenbacteria bacterium]
MCRRSPALLLGAFLAIASAAHADSLTVVPPIQAVRLNAPVTVDGVLSESIWQSAPAETQFVQRDPIEGVQPTLRTEVRVAYDDQALYVGARMWDTHPDSILARLVRRDNSCSSDRFMVFIDPLHDRRSGFYFGVNAAGVLYDGTLFNDSWDDNSWDGVWEGRAHIDNQGWTVEMRIPFSQMRFRRGPNTVWAIDFRRELIRRNETDWIVYIPRKGSGFVSRFPDLVGLGDMHAGSRAVELLPYATGKAEYLQHDPSDPFHHNSHYTPSGGADLRTSVASSLTLNATINPDFGQVEVDPAVVNLSDVESYFQEKRPFFVENSRVFSFGNEGANDYWSFNWPEPTFFYSRRIGRAPEGAIPDTVQFSDVPVATHILGAAKLTGKIGSSWNFGTVHAVTGREQAKLDFAGNNWRQDIEPTTYYEDTRAFKEFAGGRNGLGFMGSGVAREFQDGNLRDELNRSALTAGLDGFHFFDAKKVWVLSGYTAVSNVTGTQARMLALQQSSVHYLQRPGDPSVSVDSGATSMTGWVARAWLNKQNGTHFIMNAGLGAMSPTFDVNDIGFESRANVINGHLGTGWHWDTATPFRKYAQVLLAVFQARDFADRITSEGIWSDQSVTFANNGYWDQTISANPRTVNDRRTRGGPITLNLPFVQWAENVNTDSKRKVYYGLSTYYSITPQAHSFEWTASPSVTWQPMSNFSLSLGPSFDRTIENAQYVDALADPTAVETFGTRYIFAHLDQRTVSANIRVNVSFTPNVSLQTYVQPLISAGQYTNYRYLVRPDSYEFAETPYTNSNPNFNFRSLRGNAVLRWEYMPGSALYFVWTQQRTDQVSDGELEFGQSVNQLVKARANDIFLVKVSYYFPM